jgi:3-mercaptopyruvate sulfurtransferase SseA
MKTGVIVYVVGGEGLYDDLDMEKAVKKLNINADRVEVVSARSAHFDVMDAWWLLTTKGMKKIVCMLAEVVNHSKINLTGRELRLCG